MATPRYCPSCLSVFSKSTSLLRSRYGNFPPTSLRLPIHPNPQQVRTAASGQDAGALKARRKEKEKKAAVARKKKVRTTYETPDLKNAIQFSLVDAMRYLRAAEVGQSPTSSKYEIHLRLRTPKNGAVVRNRLRLPHPIRTDLRICVICPPDSAQAKAALDAGASLVGEENVFAAVKDGQIAFERCICHQDSLPKLAKSGVARILGPRGLMPSAKTGTVVRDVGASVRDLVGASEYRERLGVVRMAIGQLGFTPEEMQQNIRAFVEGVKKDIGALSDRISKDVHEVVLSSTNGPGLSLNGEFRGPASPPSADLSTL